MLLTPGTSLRLEEELTHFNLERKLLILLLNSGLNKSKATLQENSYIVIASLEYLMMAQTY